MKRFLAVALLGLIMTSTRPLSAADLKPGDEAPAFSLEGTDGKTYSLSDYKGKEAVVVAWYPKAATSG